MNHDRERSRGITTMRPAETAPESGADLKTVWHCPAITIIDIKRTMLGGSPGSDFVSSTP